MKVALIGYGYWGKNVARNFANSDFFELHTICDFNEVNLAKAKSVYPFIKTCKTVEEISDDVDVVAPIVPVDSHYPLADMFLDKGKHILLTKPFTKNYEQTKKLIDKAESKGLTAFADYTFVFNPAVRKIKEILPKIGKPFLVMSERLNLGIYQPDVNVVYDLMPHDISIISYLFETSIVEASTNVLKAANLPQDDFAQSSLVLANGVKGFVTVSWLSPYKIRQFIVIGSDGMISYDDNRVDEKVKFYDKKLSMDEISSENKNHSYASMINYRSGDLFSPFINQVEALDFELQEFKKAIFDDRVRKYYNELNLNVMKSLDVIIKSTTSFDNKKNVA